MGMGYSPNYWPYAESYCWLIDLWVIGFMQKNHIIGCSPHWKNYTEKCYYFSIEREIFEEAKLFCEEKASRLVIINNKEEQVTSFSFHFPRRESVLI